MTWGPRQAFEGEPSGSTAITQLWLAPDLGVPLDLEKSYEETCWVLRRPTK